MTKRNQQNQTNKLFSITCSSATMPKKTAHIMTSTGKKSVFSGMNFSDCEYTTPADKPPIKFAPEESNLNESSKVKFTLRDNAKACCEAKSPGAQDLTSKKKAASKTTHKLSVHEFSAGACEDALLWLADLLNFQKKKPCETPD